MTWALQSPQPAWPPDYAEQFWRAYPRRVAKKAALRALERVRRSGEFSFSALLAAVDRYAAATASKDIQFVAHPATWLNHGRWDDEPAHITDTHHGQRKISAAESWEQRCLADLERQTGANRPLRLVSKS